MTPERIAEMRELVRTSTGLVPREVADALPECLDEIERLRSLLADWESGTNHATTRLSPSARVTKQEARTALADGEG